MRDRPQFSRLDRVHTMNVVSQYQQVTRLWSPLSDAKGILSRSRIVSRQVYVAMGCDYGWLVVIDGIVGCGGSVVRARN